uniref:Protein 3 n=1 Tax=Vincetoxicum virus 1 TaxID=2977998 RepID=A0A9N6YJL8_9RHAB|nr:TPA_asm: protein 3 [Vincetoxicum virus 1]
MQSLLKRTSSCSEKGPFSGASHRLSDVTKQDFSITSINPIPESVKLLMDKSIPTEIPTEKQTFHLKWEWKQFKQESSFDFGTLGIVDAILNGSTHGKVLNHVEIHILWLPHLPMDNYINHNVSATLIFKPAEGSEDANLAKCIFPSPLHAHMIFYPGHSTVVKPRHSIPWKLQINVEDLKIHGNYHIADVYVKLVGYSSSVSVFTKKRGAEIISMIPLDEEFRGISLNHPRVPHHDWKVKTFKIGTNTSGDSKTLMKLSQYGVDIEGMQMVGKLSKLIKIVKDMDFDDSKETKVKILRTAIRIMSSP